MHSYTLQGGQIQATLWREAVDRYLDALQEGKVCKKTHSVCYICELNRYCVIFCCPYSNAAFMLLLLARCTTFQSSM